MAEEPFRLLIVDSVIALFRVDFSGRGELAECQQKLAQMLSRLTKIAEEFNVAVYLTNQVIADPGGDMFITDPKKPACVGACFHNQIDAEERQRRAVYVQDLRFS